MPYGRRTYSRKGRYSRRSTRYGRYAYYKKRKTRRVGGSRLYKFKKQVAKTKTGIHLRGLARQNKVAKEINFPLTRRNEWTIHSGNASATDTANKRIMWEWTANHPGMSDPTQQPRHLVGPTILQEDGTVAPVQPFTFINDGGADGTNHVPNFPGDALYMVGWQQFLGFPNTPNPPLYSKAIVTGSKITILIEPLEDQPGLKNATVHSVQQDANGSEYTDITDVPKYKSNNMLCALIKCKRGSTALKAGTMFEVEAKNPDCQLITVKAFSEAKNRNGKMEAKFSARGTFGTALKTDEDIVLEMGRNSGTYKPDSYTRWYQNSADKDWIYRFVVYPEDRRFCVPDFKLTVVEEMNMHAYDVYKEGKTNLSEMRIEQAVAGATNADTRNKKRKTGQEEDSMTRG